LNQEFKTHSIAAWVSVDPETWEVLSVLEEETNSGIVRPGSFSPPMYSQLAIDQARSVTSELCERIIAHITDWKRIKRWNNRWHDIVTPSWHKIEAKVWRVGNSAVIKENQLFQFDANYWWFVFYRTTKNLPPSYFTSLENNIWPIATLKRNISVEIAYILPSEVMRYYWNTADVKRWVISTTWISHRPSVVSRAEALLLNEQVPGERFASKKSYLKHNFPVKSIGFEL